MNNYCTRALLYNTNQTTVQIVHKYVKLVFDTRLPPSFNDISDDRQIKSIAIGSKPITEKPTDDEVLKENNINIRNLGYVDTMPGSRQNKGLYKLDPNFFPIPTVRPLLSGADYTPQCSA